MTDFAAKKWNNLPVKEYRKFGLAVGSIFAFVFGLAVPLIFKGHVVPWALVLGSFLMILGLIWPAGLRPFYVIWMTLGFVLGYVNSRIILSLVFFGIVTPLGFFVRRFSSQGIPLNYERDRETYRETRNTDVIQIERPF